MPRVVFPHSRENVRRLGIFLNGAAGQGSFLTLQQDCVSRFEAAAQVTLFLSHPARDAALAREILARSPAAGLVAYAGDTGRFASSIAQQDALVAFRLHGAIAGLRLGKPVFIPAELAAHPAMAKLITLHLPEGFKSLFKPVFQGQMRDFFEVARVVGDHGGFEFEGAATHQ
jgi:hypothetical protein